MGLEVVLPLGSIIHTGSMCAKDVVGYNITQLFVGSEGTLGVITKAVLKLLPLPQEKSTLTATFSSMDMAANSISGIIRAGVIPATLEFLDRHTIRAVEDYLHLGLPETAEAFLLVEIDGDTDEVLGKIERIKEIFNANRAVDVKTAQDEKEQKELWKARRAISASLLRIRTGKLNEDIVVPRSRIPDILKEIEKIGKTHGLIIPCFGHAGDGNIHVNVMYDKSKGEFERASQAVYDIFQKTVEMKGRISGEHGIGMTKKDYMTMNLDPPTIKLMQDIKKAVDPCNILNPEKIFPK
jgi:glycolate oxidase